MLTQDVKKVSVWAGSEFEERVRKDAPEFVKRFADGVTFPHTSGSILAFAKDALVKDDKTIVSAVLQNF